MIILVVNTKVACVAVEELVAVLPFSVLSRNTNMVVEAHGCKDALCSHTPSVLTDVQ